jgi:hypothetical protein
MAGHTSEKRWRNNQTNDSGLGVSTLVTESANGVLNALTEAENKYQDLQELYAFAGGTAQLLADQLFFENWTSRESDPIGNPGVLDAQANSTEVAKATDLINAVTAMHELYQAATNVAVAQEDRFAQLRRMT